MFGASDANKKSKISVVFNERFCQFVSALKRDCASTVDLLKESNIHILMGAQKELREYIIDHQSAFECSSRIGDTSYPDMFAIMICIILPASELNTDTHNSFQSILDANVEDRKDLRSTVTLYSSREEGMDATDAEVSRDTMRCACNHTCQPRNLFLIANYITNLNLLVGCDCICKTKFIERVALNNMIKASKNDPAYKYVNRQLMVENLKGKDETVESLTLNYVYSGGNCKLYMGYCKQHNIDRAVSIDNTRCFICDDLIKNIIFIKRRNTETVLYICTPCCKVLDLYPNPKKCNYCGRYKHGLDADSNCLNCVGKKFARNILYEWQSGVREIKRERATIQGKIRAKAMQVCGLAIRPWVQKLKCEIRLRKQRTQEERARERALNKQCPVGPFTGRPYKEVVQDKPYTHYITGDVMRWNSMRDISDAQKAYAFNYAQRIDKLNENLSQFEITDILKKQYEYYGGTYGLHATYTSRKYTPTNENFDANKCDICMKSTPNLLFIASTDSSLVACEECCQFLELYPRPTCVNSACENLVYTHNPEIRTCATCQHKRIYAVQAQRERKNALSRIVQFGKKHWGITYYELIHNDKSYVDYMIKTMRPCPHLNYLHESLSAYKYTRADTIGRVYINAVKDDARKAKNKGALWDGGKVSWYIPLDAPDSVRMEILNKWTLRPDT